MNSDEKECALGIRCLELIDERDAALKKIAGLFNDNDTLYASYKKMQDKKEAWKLIAEHLSKSIDSYRFEGYVRWDKKRRELMKIARELEKT
jgi:hypothetical protein